MEFDNLFELLDAVRCYPTTGKECIIPLLSVDGTVFGYTTADGEGPAVTWSMNLREAKKDALYRGTHEARMIRAYLVTHQGHRELLQKLREGSLECLVVWTPVVPVRKEPSAEEKTPSVGEPRQCLIPGL